MENSKSISISRHSIVRYFSRVKNQILTDNNYDIWKTTHTLEVEQAKEEIKLMLENALYIHTGNYNNHRKAEYYIDVDAMVTFVIAERTLVTLYPVDYGLDEIANKLMFQVLYDNYLRYLNEEEKATSAGKEKKRELEIKSKELGLEIQSLTSQADKLRAEKKEIESLKEKFKAEEKYYAAKINLVREKMILSKRAF